MAEGISMEHKIIATYCLIDEMLKGLQVKNDVRAKITNAEILTMAYLAVSDFNGNYRKAHLKKKGVRAKLLTFRAFLTLFSCDLPSLPLD